MQGPAVLDLSENRGDDTSMTDAMLNGLVETEYDFRRPFQGTENTRDFITSKGVPDTQTEINHSRSRYLTGSRKL